MDTQFDWLSTYNLAPSIRAPEPAAPPHVSFGNNGVSGNNNVYPTRTPSADGFRQNFDADSGNQSVPLSLQAHELSLEESKTYMRWYLDILARTNLRTIAISDVYHFLGNFKLLAEVKSEINRIFQKILLLINIGEFFAVLRVVAHALQGRSPHRSLIKHSTGVPSPPSILSKKRHSDENDDASNVDDEPEPQQTKPLDIDLFTEFMLTGERPGAKKRLKKLKSVKFSENVVSDIQHTYAPAESPNTNNGDLDYLLPMDQLLSRMTGSNQNQNQNQLAVPQMDTRLRSPDPEERQILRDMEPQMNHFQHLHSVDTMLVDGVPANLHLQHNSDLFLPRNSLPQNSLPPLLRPNMTGPAQMALMGVPPSQEFDQPLRPNVTGPLDMARFLPQNSNTNSAPKISLQAFTSQMAGETADNTNQNSRIGQVPAVSPPPVPATRRARSASQPSPLNLPWPAANNGNNSDLIYPPDPGYDSARALPLYSHTQPYKPAPPPPPPPRSRRVNSASSQLPPPLPAKIPNEPIYQTAQGSSSTTNILDDLKALQEEVDRIRDMTGGF